MARRPKAFGENLKRLGRLVMHRAAFSLSGEERFGP